MSDRWPTRTLATESPNWTSASSRVSLMAQSFDLHEQAAHCGPLNRGCTDIGLRARLLGFAGEYSARAAVLDVTGDIIRTAGLGDESPG